MRRGIVAFAGMFAVTVGSARGARADDATDLRAELEAMKRRIEAQDRRIHELEGPSRTSDEIATAVDAYMARTPIPAVLTAEGAKGSAGFPLGKKPFIKEGPNKLEFTLRNQVRYEAFLYSDDARANTTDTRKPHDRSGWEVERLLVGFEGTVFCEDLAYRIEFNFGSDEGSSLQKRYAYLDWKYGGEHHLRGGNDKVAFSLGDQTGTGSLMFVDRNLAQQAFRISFDSGVSLWGYFGDACGNDRRFLYKLQVTNGEGNGAQIPIFGTDALNTFSDQPLLSGLLEWRVTGRDFKFDEVDSRSCEDRCCLDLAIGASAYHENDDDKSLTAPGSLAVKGNAGVGPLARTGWSVWMRGQWQGWSWQTEFLSRHIDFTAGSTALDQDDTAFYAQLHYRFPYSNWGVGVKYAVVNADSDYYSGVWKDSMSEFGVALNYFFWDHSHKITADVTVVTDNGGVTNKNSGYLVSAAKGVALEDGVMVRVQWQIQI